jgi:hypothetical protein
MRCTVVAAGNSTTVVYLETMADFGVTAVGTGLCSCHKLLLLKLWLMLPEVKQHGLQVLRRFVATKHCISWRSSQCRLAARAARNVVAHGADCCSVC